MPAKKDVPQFVYCLGGCGEKIEINTQGRRQTYLRNGGIYCRDCVNKRNSERMKKKNPMANPLYREKMREALKIKGYKPKVLGGNGRDYPKAQRLLIEALGRGWWPELSIPTRHTSGLANNYKVDIANIYYGIIIEVDGGSHKGEASRIKDKKKEDFLKSKEWEVLRFSNKEILNNLDSVMQEIMFTISKCKEHTIISPMEY